MGKYTFSSTVIFAVIFSDHVFGNGNLNVLHDLGIIVTPPIGLWPQYLRFFAGFLAVDNPGGKQGGIYM